MMLLPNERIDQLPGGSVQIIQNSEVFSYSLDAVLLADFIKCPKQGTFIELGSGNGAIPLFLSQKTDQPIIGIEIQKKLVDMAKRSVNLNHLDHQISFIHDNLNQLTQYIPKDSVDVVFTNPPYYTADYHPKTNPNEHLAIARHEIHTSLNEVIKTASDVLKMKGHFFMVHRPERFLEIITYMINHHLIPKRIQWVYPKSHKEANIVLIEGIKYGKINGLIVLPPLIVFKQNNTYTERMQEIFKQF